MAQEKKDITVNEIIQRDGEEQIRKTQEVQDEGLKHQEEVLDDYTGEKVKYVPTPNFTDCNSSGTVLPVNMVSETILTLSALSKTKNLTEYVMEELHYSSKLAVCMAFSSEQVEAICLIIEQLKKGKGFILGDMAGIGKGRVVAGVLRYAYHNGIIPTFLTFTPSLFSAMYADILDIGGFGTNERGKIILPKPFMLNDIGDTNAAIIDEFGRELYLPDDKETVYKICKKGALPKSYNCVFLTYSQISSTRKREGDKENVKHFFLKNIASNAIYLFDESHIASGLDTTVGELSREIIRKSKGVIFSSATYAKNPQAFSLYVIKTALAEAQIDISKIEKAISVGGDNVAEYIASAMVKEGQMIRRERSYAGCEVSTIYKNGDESLETAKRNIYRMYDAVMADFRELYSYLKSDAFKSGAISAVDRIAERRGFELVDVEHWNKTANTLDLSEFDGDTRGERAMSFLDDNLGKWIPRVDYDTIGATTKFHFKENLLLAVKAKLSADTILNELGTRREYTYFDGKQYLTNRKPVIAIRSTLESIFDKFNLEEGESIENDFSEYTKAIAKKCRRGRVVFVKVTEDFFEKGRKLSATRKAQEIKDYEYNVDDSDLADAGERLNIIQDKIESFVAGVPLSVIDYLREEIQAKERADWDTITPNNPQHKNPNPNYVFLEVTGRNKMLLHIGGGRWIITKNNKLEKRKESFNQFNNGMGDVLLINSSGSTGESAHSSEKFEDKRPRITCLLQPELNINTEVQKRGRTLRTGMVNYPAYAYIISLVPSEMRMFLSMRKKMRKLDANTSANQINSSDITDIRDANGDPIHDFFNKYGVNAFQNDFINLTGNEYYANIWNELGDKSDELEKLEDFCRILELELSTVQEQFYNEMNQKYIDEVRKQIALQTYQLELETINYKAALQGRVLRALGYGNSEFSKPLFIEDKFTLETRKTLPLEKVQATVSKLCNGLRPDEFHKQMLEEFNVEYTQYIAGVIAKLDTKAPKKFDYDSKEAFAEATTKHREYMEAKRQEYSAKKGMLEATLNWFSPNRKVLIPDNFMELQGKDVVKDIVVRGDDANVKGKQAAAVADVQEMLKKREAEEKKKEMVRPIPAIFMGYKIKTSASTTNKYGEGNIEFHFALLNGTPPVLVLKPSRDAVVLKEIQNQSLELSSRFGRSYNQTIDEWRFDPNRRYVKRFLSGNILAAIVDANNMRDSKNPQYDEDLKTWELVRYTNYDGSVSTGIRLNYGEKNGLFPLTRTVYDKKSGEVIDTESTFDLSVPTPHPNVITYVQSVPPIWSRINAKSAQIGGYVDINDGWIRIVRNSEYKDSYELHVYNGAGDKGKNHITDTKSILYNPFYWNADFLSILQSNFIVQPSESWALNNNYLSKDDRSRAVFVKVYRFDFGNERHARTFMNAMSYLWENGKAMLSFKKITDEYYTVIDSEDIFDESNEKSKSEKIFSEGEYEYAFESKPKDGIVYPNKVRIMPPSSKVGMYGGVVLNYPLEPHLLLPFAMYPVNLSYADSVKLWLNMFDEMERIRVMQELNSMCAAGKSVREIGNWVDLETATKVADLKYVFGDLDIVQVGELMKTYHDSGDLSQLNFQVQKQSAIEAPKKKSKVDYEAAEKFLIYMLS